MGERMSAETDRDPAQDNWQNPEPMLITCGKPECVVGWQTATRGPIRQAFWIRACACLFFGARFSTSLRLEIPKGTPVVAADSSTFLWDVPNSTFTDAVSDATPALSARSPHA